MIDLERKEFINDYFVKGTNNIDYVSGTFYGAFGGLRLSRFQVMKRLVDILKLNNRANYYMFYIQGIKRKVTIEVYPNLNGWQINILPYYKTDCDYEQYPLF